jgi:hypothetical protein
MRPPRFDDVCEGLLREGQAVRFRAAGLSMEPAIRDGDDLTVAPVAIESVRRGDVLLYRAGGRLTAHRVIGRVEGRQGVLRVRGDAPSWEEERVPRRDVLGRVVAVERRGQPVPLRGPLARGVASLARRIRRRLSTTRTVSSGRRSASGSGRSPKS